MPSVEKAWGSLPVVAAFAGRLRIRDVIDGLCPVDDRAGAGGVEQLHERGELRLGPHRRPDHPELEVTLSVPGPPLDDQTAGAIRRALANGTMGGFGLHTDDCRKTYEELSAAGVEFVQLPSEQPYGIEAVLRDNSGNWLVLIEPRSYRGEDFAHA